MADANTHVKVHRLKALHVPEALINGNKFIKWDESSTTATPVTLKVDPCGYFLFWKDQNKDVECLDLTSLRDTRTGKYAQTPKDIKLQKNCSMGSQDVDLADKTLTVVYATEMISPSFINFCSNSDATVQDWADVLLKLAYAPAAQNPSPITNLQKAYMKLTIMVNRENKILVKNIKKMFASSREDKKKVENALAASGVNATKEEGINPSKFTFEDFFTFYMRLINQKEIDKVFQNIGAKNKPYLNTQQLVKFFNDEQRDPRLNEILFPFADPKKAKELVDQFEPNKAFSKKGQLSVDGLVRYLLSEENTVVGPEMYTLSQNMSEPMAHYFINSSHNTYLLGHQLTGRSSVEIYRQVLLAGCRCVELDCWDGKTAEEEPIITHGFTMCTEVLFKDVIEAINESAFKTSDFPVILSFENHCSVKQQSKMAAYCRSIFGDNLLVDPIEDFPLESGKVQPSPEDIKRKILVKNKKRKASEKKRSGRRLGSVASQSSIESYDSAIDPGTPKHTRASRKSSRRMQQISEFEDGAFVAPGSPKLRPVTESKTMTATVTVSKTLSVESSSSGDKPAIESGAATPTAPSATATPAATPDAVATPAAATPTATTPAAGTPAAATTPGATTPNAPVTAKPSDALDNVDEESDSDDEETMSKEEIARYQQQKKEQGTAGQEAEAGAEMSALVNYAQPVHFHSFEISERRNHSYEMSSWVETSAMNRLKENPVAFVNYNKRQMSRIYPRGTRVDSSNYMPQIFWNVGCQMVALNYQSLDLPMQLNMGVFEHNHRCGYILKPDFMRRKDRFFDPFAESTMDGVVPATVEFKVIAGHFLSDKRVGTYVEVDMFGLPADTVRRKHKTQTVSGSAINPVYDSKAFVFKKIIMPQVAMLRVAVYEDSGKLIGHKILPVVGTRPGYRHICLRNEFNQPLMLPSLFVHVKVKDYVPDGFADFADALMNPIAYQSEIDKREDQLKALEDDAEIDENAVGALDGVEAIKKLKQVDADADESTDSKAGTAPPAGTAGYQKKPPTNGDTNGAAPTKAPVTPSVSVNPSSSTAVAAKNVIEKKNSVSTTQISQAEDIEAATLEEVKQQKKFIKLKKRLDGELEKLIKKQEKKQSKLKKIHEKECSKHQSAHNKAKKEITKKHGKLEKKAIKSKNMNPDELKRLNAEEMDSLSKDHESEGSSIGDLSVDDMDGEELTPEQLVEVQRVQEESLIELYKIHYEEEKEMKKDHMELLYAQLMELMGVLHDKQLKMMEQQHKKQSAQMRKDLNQQNTDEVKQLLTRKGDKNEMARLKKEAQRKHITRAVEVRQGLEEVQQKKKVDLENKMAEAKELVPETRDEEVNKLDDEFENKCDKLMKDRKFGKTNGHTSKNGPTHEPATERRQLETLREEDGGSPTKNGINGTHLEVEANGNES